MIGLIGSRAAATKRIPFWGGFSAALVSVQSVTPFSSDWPARLKFFHREWKWRPSAAIRLGTKGVFRHLKGRSRRKLPPGLAHRAAGLRFLASRNQVCDAHDRDHLTFIGHVLFCPFVAGPDEILSGSNSLAVLHDLQFTIEDVTDHRVRHHVVLD